MQQGVCSTIGDNIYVCAIPFTIGGENNYYFEVGSPVFLLYMFMALLFESCRVSELNTKSHVLLVPLFIEWHNNIITQY